MNKIKVAVIGYGHLGKWHAQKAESFPELSVLKYIVEKFPAGQAAAAAAHPNAIIVDDISKCIHDIDAGFVVTPTSFHYDIVEYLLKNKKHVFCEKPVTETTAQALKLKELLLKNPAVLQVGHSERFHQAWEQKSKYSQFFEAPSHITLKRVAPFKGRATDVDVVQDLMIHDLDLLVYLMRNEISEALGSHPGPEFVALSSYEKRDHLLLEHKNFYHSIINKLEPVITLEDGLIAVRLIDQVLESVNSGLEVIL